MPFPYYRRLNKTQKAIYRRSTAIESITLPRPELGRPAVHDLARALEDDDPGGVVAACQALADQICRQLQVPLVQVTVLAARPSESYGELHGLYEPGEPPYRSRITLWMRTRQRQQVVAFKTFLRTLLHELVHHLDYEYLELAETLHTEGFYQRESSLFRQLVGRARSR